MIKSMSSYLIFTFFFLMSGVSYAGNFFSYTEINSCVLQQSARYDVPADLIWKIIRVESDGLTTAINRKGTPYLSLSRSDAQLKLNHYVDKDLSADIGLMQINVYHLRRSINISHVDLKNLLNPCFNIAMGTFIISERIRHLGYTWGAVGSYNVGMNGMRGVRGQRLQRLGVRYINRVKKASGHPMSVKTPVESYSTLEKIKNRG